MFRISALSALACLLAIPASAAVVTVTGSGLVFWGSDATDEFGLGGNIDGQRATLTFVYDTALLPNRYQYSDSTGVADTSNDHWWAEEEEHVFLSATLELNGVILGVSGENSESAQAFWQQADGTQGYYFFSGDYTSNDEFFSQSYVNLIQSIADTSYADAKTLDDVFSWTGVNRIDSRFRFTEYSIIDGAYVYARDTSGYVTLDSLTITRDDDPVLPAVPLPAGAWLLASAIGLGGVLRRKARRRPETAA